MIKKQRAFLKWAGGKYKLADKILDLCPQGERLVEPFVGAGSIFLNSNYKHHILCDINKDLIGLYELVKKDVDEYIYHSKQLFNDENNDKQRYYQFRDKFNQSNDKLERAVLFLYFNRFGFNGLCRYNKSGGFNVPFGSYKRPYFPEAELVAFAEKAQTAEFHCIGYQQAFKLAQPGDVIYCDPPYAPLSTTSNFTTYASSGFSLDDQAQLAVEARQSAYENGVPVVISNHDTVLTRELYHGAKLSSIEVQRNISQKATTRIKVPELIAQYIKQ
ncbi:Dam family site-specific DNA-(adenine-N6)-methyltransferase [Paraferrimonas sp. SM1919]|uniref:Dam family site-specific DNA-(adenine-N6)-methyltransferase n=1 Tax=Paraferrimonas sp. SM1919 TaxID=2662263 RepID=UPI0013D62568|nr:Dam family site-specific DNA-(adenine-N6)-methyltransferase [Paraferrimonas sp. SM1919]